MSSEKSVLDVMRGKLLAPFAAKDVQFRIGARANGQGLALAYVDARAVQRRMDDVFGWDCWEAAYRFEGSGWVCRLIITIPGDQHIAKEDGADVTQVEKTKGGISDAFKRCAASGFGIGRYLYDLDAIWAPLNQSGKEFATVPELPVWARPDGDETMPTIQQAPLGAPAAAPNASPAPQPSSSPAPAPAAAPSQGAWDTCPKCGSSMQLKNGSHGSFYGCTGYPDCRLTIPSDAPAIPPEFAKCDKCGKPMVPKYSKKNDSYFVGCCGYPECSNTKHIPSAPAPQAPAEEDLGSPDCPF